MSNTATVTKSEFTGKTWERDGKTFYIHAIEFSNGEGGEYLSVDQNQTKFVQGQEVEYDRVPKDGYPDKIKPVQSGKPFGGGGGGKRSSNASFGLSYSKDWAIAQVNNGIKVSTQDILTVADTFLKWLNDNE